MVKLVQRTRGSRSPARAGPTGRSTPPGAGSSPASLWRSARNASRRRRPPGRTCRSV